MEQAEQNDLFEIRLNEEGKRHIRKFVSIAEAVIILGIILSAISLATNIIRLIKVDPSIFSHDKLLSLENRLYFYFTLIYTILFFLQLYYYWKMGSYMTKGIKYNDSKIFNQSFHTLCRYALTGIVIFVLVIIMNVLDLYWTVHHYL